MYSVCVCVSVCAVSSCGMLSRQEELSGTSGTNQERRRYFRDTRGQDEKEGKKTCRRRRNGRKRKVEWEGEESGRKVEEEEECTACPLLVGFCRRIQSLVLFALPVKIPEGPEKQTKNLSLLFMKIIKFMFSKLLQSDPLLRLFKAHDSFKDVLMF